MDNKIALIIGATGLVGQHLVKQLLQDENYQVVHVFVRRLISLSLDADPHSKLIQHVVDFNNIHSWQQKLNGDELFCCIGTTLKQAGSKKNQTKIDLELPSEIAQYANTNGVKKVALVSAAGANHVSSSFYLRLKGELEQNLLALNWQQVVIVRPSFLDGHRNEFRFGERFAIALFSFLKYLPWIKNYRPIKAEQVAKRMRLLVDAKPSESLVIEELEQLFG
jgi:uncharacterized protein YbjT (DUF2867 family)